MSRSVLLSALALAATLLTPAAAGATAFAVDGWEGRSTSIGGAFDHCMMSAKSDGGETLVVALNPRGDVGLGIAQPGLQVDTGTSMPLAYRAGDHIRARAMANVVSPETLLAWFEGPDYPRHLVPISKVGVLVLTVGERQRRFDTTPSEAAVQALIDCVQTNLEQHTEQRAWHFMEKFRLQ